MTEEKRKEGILKRYKDLPKGVVTYIDFLIIKINKLVSENTHLAKHIIELQKDKGELVDKTKELQHRLDVAQGFLDRDKEYNRLLDVINNQDVKIADLEEDLKHKKIAIQTRNKRIKELEKESEENQDLASIAYMQGAERKQKQLEQAKKLLNAFLDFESACMENGMTIAKDIREQAEQFLNLSEKPNSSEGVEKC